MATATARRKASLSSAKRIKRRGRRVRRGEIKPEQRSCEQISIYVVLFPVASVEQAHEFLRQASAKSRFEATASFLCRSFAAKKGS